MAKFSRLYAKAYYYDIVFERDVAPEVVFVNDLFRQQTGRELRSVLDICCGPGYHARAFARRGTQAVGLDLHPEMLAFGREKVAGEDLPLTWIEADMRDFNLDAPVDAAICLFYGIDALLTHADLLAHLRSVARNLNPDGIYVIHYAHPRDYSHAGYPPMRFRGERDGTGVEITWGTNQPVFDPVTNVAEVAIEIRIKEAQTEVVLSDAARERLLTPAELSLLADLSGAFRVVGFYGDYRLDQPLDDSPGATHMVAVLQRT